MKAEQIIFATGNAGKMKEIRMILADLGLEVQSMKEAGVDVDIDESGTTFEENAMIKASALRRRFRKTVCGQSCSQMIPVLRSII